MEREELAKAKASVVAVTQGIKQVRPEWIVRETLQETLKTVLHTPQARRGLIMLIVAVGLFGWAAPGPCAAVLILAGLLVCLCLSSGSSDVSGARRLAWAVYLAPCLSEVAARTLLLYSLGPERSLMVAGVAAPFGSVVLTVFAGLVIAASAYSVMGDGRRGLPIVAMGACLAVNRVLCVSRVGDRTLLVVAATVLTRFALCEEWALGGIGARVGPAARQSLTAATRRAAYAPLKDVAEDELLHAALAKCVVEYWNEPSSFKFDDCWPMLISSIAFVGAGAAAAGGAAAMHLESKLCQESFDADRAAEEAAMKAQEAIGQLAPDARLAKGALVTAAAPTIISLALTGCDRLSILCLLSTLISEVSRLQKVFATVTKEEDGLTMLLGDEPNLRELAEAYANAKSFAKALGSTKSRATLRTLQTSARAKSLAQGVARLGVVSATAYATGGDGGINSATNLAVAIVNEARLLASGRGDALQVIRDARVVGANAEKLWTESGAADAAFGAVEYVDESVHYAIEQVPTDPTWWAWTSAYVGGAASGAAAGACVAGPIGAIVGAAVGGASVQGVSYAVGTEEEEVAAASSLQKTESTESAVSEPASLAPSDPPETDRWSDIDSDEEQDDLPDEEQEEAEKEEEEEVPPLDESPPPLLLLAPPRIVEDQKEADDELPSEILEAPSQTRKEDGGDVDIVDTSPH